MWSTNTRIVAKMKWIRLQRVNWGINYQCHYFRIPVLSGCWRSHRMWTSRDFLCWVHPETIGGGTITCKTVITTTYYAAIGTCMTFVLPQGFHKGAAYEIIVEFSRRWSLMTGHPWNHILLGIIHRWMVSGLLAVLGPLCGFPGGPLIIGHLTRFGPSRAARGPRFKHRFGRHFRRTAIVR